MSLDALRAWAAEHRIVSLTMSSDLRAVAWLKHWNEPLHELPELIGLLQGLTTIDLRHNGLRQLPAAIGQLHRLESLTSMSNLLQSLPDQLHHLQRLRYLDLRDNALHRLPPSLGALSQLRMLILNDNCLSELPTEIGQLKQLEHLDLSRNPLRSLPEQLHQCEALNTLDISGTLISHLPDWLGEMPNLRHLKRGPNVAAEIGQAIQWHGKHPYIAPPAIDNEPFTLWFERQLAGETWGPLKITFRKILQQELTDESIASKAKGMIGSEDWPEGWFVWGEDASGEYIEYYQRSRWGDSHGRINSDGSHVELPALWHIGPIDDDYLALEAELKRKGLLNSP